MSGTNSRPSCHTKGCDSLSYLSKGRYDETFAGEDDSRPIGHRVMT